MQLFWWANLYIPGDWGHDLGINGDRMKSVLSAPIDLFLMLKLMLDQQYCSPLYRWPFLIDLWLGSNSCLRRTTFVVVSQCPACAVFDFSLSSRNDTWNGGYCALAWKALTLVPLECKHTWVSGAGCHQNPEIAYETGRAGDVRIPQRSLCVLLRLVPPLTQEKHLSVLSSVTSPCLAPVYFPRRCLNVMCAGFCLTSAALINAGEYSTWGRRRWWRQGGRSRHGEDVCFYGWLGRSVQCRYLCR